MLEWKDVTLGKVIAEGNGLLQTGPFGSQLHASDYVVNGVPCIMPFNMKDNRVNLSGIARISDKDARRLSQHLVKAGDIVYSRRGDITQKVLISESEDGFFCGTGCILIRLGNGVNSKFVTYFLSTKESKEWLINNAVGITMPNLNTKILYKLPLRLPSENYQQKIAAVLSSLDSKIELNNKINTELEAMAKMLYDYWFVQFDFPDSDGKPYKSSGGKMVWNDDLKRDIPDGWEVGNLFNVMDVQYGFPFDTTKFTNDITQKPVIRIRDILENTISTYSTEDVQDKYILYRNDLLIGMDGNFHLNFWDKDGAYLNQRSVRIRSKQNTQISNFQAYFELSPHIKAREKNVSRTTVGHLSDKDLKRLFLISPKSSDKFKPKEMFDSILGKIISHRLQNETHANLRDWLLPMLMNGQVKVNN